MLSDLPLVFLASVAIISLSGVMMPGPVFAATVAQGYHDKNAGLKLTLGHAVVELPLLALIFLGFATIFSQPEVVAGIGLIGGVILIWMGYDMIKARETMVRSEGGIHRTAFQDGVYTTITNPYWMLWWATVGAALVASAVEYGIWMLPLFGLVHISCDAGWEVFITQTVNRTKGLWNVRWHHLLIVFSGGIMLLFGLYFLLSSLGTFI